MSLSKRRYDAAWFEEAHRRVQADKDRHALMISVRHRRGVQWDRGDTPTVRSLRAKSLYEKRWFHRYRYVHFFLVVGPALIVLLLLLIPTRSGVKVPPVKPPVSVPARVPEPEPVHVIDEPYEYQGLEVS
jgi:hypothetical protein